MLEQELKQFIADRNYDIDKTISWEEFKECQRLIAAARIVLDSLQEEIP